MIERGGDGARFQMPHSKDEGKEGAAAPPPGKCSKEGEGDVGKWSKGQTGGSNRSAIILGGISGKG